MNHVRTRGRSSCGGFQKTWKFFSYSGNASEFRSYNGSNSTAWSGTKGKPAFRTGAKTYNCTVCNRRATREEDGVWIDERDEQFAGSCCKRRLALR